MDDLEKRLREKFEGYTFEIEIPDKESFNPKLEILDVIITTKTGERYSICMATPDYLPWVFAKNKRTGECDNGRWWAKPENIIYVDEINDENVKLGIDRAIENNEIESYFRPISQHKYF